MESQYRGGRAVRSTISQANHTSTGLRLTILQAKVGVSGKAKDLAAIISSGERAKQSRAENRAKKEKEEKERAEQEWKERQDREREKDKQKT